MEAKEDDLNLNKRNSTVDKNPYDIKEIETSLDDAIQTKAVKKNDGTRVNYKQMYNQQV